jgi:hypothetical protein
MEAQKSGNIYIDNGFELQQSDISIIFSFFTQKLQANGKEFVCNHCKRLVYEPESCIDCNALFCS